MYTRVCELLETKGCDVVTITPHATVYQAIETMVDRKVGSVLVIDRGKLQGIFTERDYMRRIVLCGRTSKTTEVHEVMDRVVHTVSPDDSVEECMATMTRYRTRHLPVVHRGRLVGLVSIGDCVAHLIEELTVENQHLHEYIGGYCFG